MGSAARQIAGEGSPGPERRPGAAGCSLSRARPEPALQRPIGFTHPTRFGAESLERCMRGTLLDEARLAVADAEMCFREERSSLCPFVGCVGLLPELLRCDEVRYGLFSCPCSESDRTERVFGRCQQCG